MSEAAHGHLFDSLLNLEEQYYAEGYEQGVADGSRAGRIEGRIFGLEKGFEKFVAMGRLHGKATVWSEMVKRSQEQNRKPKQTDPSSEGKGSGDQKDTTEPAEHIVQEESASESNGNKSSTFTADAGPPQELRPLPHSERLERHIRTLYALTEPATFSTQNDEDSVADFDDRLNRAEAKAKLITHHIKGSSSQKVDQDSSPSKRPNDQSSPRRGLALKREETGNNVNIEDFGKVNKNSKSHG
jgi:hypothetical protein